MQFYKAALQNKSVKLGLGADKVKIIYIIHQSERFCVMLGIIVEIGCNAVFQRFRLTHIYYKPAFVLHQIYARRKRQTI